MVFSKKQIEFFTKLEEYYYNFHKAIKPRIKMCGPCIDCCAYLISMIPSPLEIDYSMYYLTTRGNPNNLPVLSWEEYVKSSAGLCIYCNPETKSCMLYEARFNICRTYGPFVADTDITMYSRCVYKGNSVHLSYKKNLVPYYNELQELIKGYLELMPENINKLYIDIRYFGKMADKRVEYAAEHYKELIKKYPHIGDLYFWLARSSIALGKAKEGMELFKKSVEINPEQCESYLDMGLYYYQKGMIDKAEELFRKAIHIEPKDSQSRYLLVLSLIRGNKLSEGSLEFKKLMDESFLYEEKKLREGELVDIMLK